MIKQRLCDSDSKESACNAGDPGSIPGWGRYPREGNGNQPTPVFLLGEFQDRGAWHHIPWGCKESDTTEQLALALFRAIDIM